MTVKINISRVYIQSDSLIIVNAVNDKSMVPKKIINIIENIRLPLLSIKEHRMEYCNRYSNRQTDALAKKVIM